MADFGCPEPSKIMIDHLLHLASWRGLFHFNNLLDIVQQCKM